MNLEILSEKHIPVIYDLLRSVNFPTMPEDFNLASISLKQAINLGHFRGNQLLLWIALLHHDNQYYIDIACDNKIRGKWANKKNIRNFLNIIFSLTSGQPIFAEPRTEEALRLCLGLGFKKQNQYYILIKGD